MRPIDWEERMPGLAGAVFLPALWLWHTRGEWELAVPAFLLAAVIGLGGVGVYRLAARLRDGTTGLTGVFLSGAAAITLVVGATTWYAGGGPGWREATGSLAAGAGVSCWLVFLRILVWGVPEEADAA